MIVRVMVRGDDEGESEDEWGESWGLKVEG